MIKDLKYLMSYSIALFAFIGISLGGFYNYLAVVFTFVFIPVLEIIVKKSDEKYTDEEKKNKTFGISEAQDQSIRRLLLILSILDEGHGNVKSEAAAQAQNDSNDNPSQRNSKKLFSQLTKLTKFALGANPGKELNVADIPDGEDPGFVPPHLSKSAESTALVMKSMLHIVLLSQDFVEGHYRKKMNNTTSSKEAARKEKTCRKIFNIIIFCCFVWISYKFIQWLQ